MKRAVDFLLGGALVYVAMAANAAGCSSSPGGGEGGTAGGPSGAAGAVAQAGASGTTGAGGAGGIFDPVPHADAKSVTRLKAKVYRGADGSEQPTFA